MKNCFRNPISWSSRNRFPTVTTADVFDHEGNKMEDYSKMNTEFRIHWCLKGDLKTGKFTVLHFRYSDKIGGVANGAYFARFLLKERHFRGQWVSDENKMEFEKLR